MECQSCCAWIGPKYYYLGPGRKELQGKVIGVIRESSNLFCNLLHDFACDSLSELL